MKKKRWKTWVSFSDGADSDKRFNKVESHIPLFIFSINLN